MIALLGQLRAEGPHRHPHHPSESPGRTSCRLHPDHGSGRADCHWPRARLSIYPRRSPRRGRYEDQRGSHTSKALASLTRCRSIRSTPKTSPPLRWRARSPCRSNRSSKTLLTTTGPEQYAFAVIPGDAELDFKKLARAAGVRKTELVSLKDVQGRLPATSVGVSPSSGQRRSFLSLPDETIELFDFISVSAGQRGTQILLAPQDYLRAAKAMVAALTKDSMKDAARS